MLKYRTCLSSREVDECCSEFAVLQLQFMLCVMDAVWCSLFLHQRSVAANEKMNCKDG